MMRKFNLCLVLMLLSLPPSMVSAELPFADGFEGCHQTCMVELECATPQPGEACISGRLLDVENNALICTLPAATATCSGPSADGPCALALRIFDALGFINNPLGAFPIAASETLVDGCGRFRISGFDVPSSGFGMVSIDDAIGTQDRHVLSAGVRPVTSGAELEQTRLYAVRHTTDQNWTASAGAPFGASTFAQTGSYLPIFLHSGTPVPGVALIANGNTVSNFDYYFSDSNPSQRRTVDAGQSASGANGSSLFISNTLVEITGNGGEPAGCQWPSIPGGSTSGVVVVQEFAAELTDQAGVACP